MHAQALARQLDALTAAWAATEERLPDARGRLATAEALSGSSLAIDSLGDKNTDVVVVESSPERAVLHVRNDDLGALRRKVEAYAESETPRGRPRNEPLVAPLEVVRETSYQDLAAGDLAAIAIDPDASYWVELWTDGGRLAERETRDRVRRVIDELATISSAENPEPVTFVGTERDIHLVRLSGSVLLDLPNLAPDVYRVARPSEARADRLARDYAGDLVGDATVELESADSAVVAVLDTGVAEEHPLLREVLAARGVSVVPGELSAIDRDGHGTELAGLVAFGDRLAPDLLAGGPVMARAKIESVLCYSPGGDPPLWAARTEAAVEAAEAFGAQRRVFNLALSDPSSTTGDRTSWSTALDRLAYNDGRGRLICVALGNAQQFANPDDYPAHNMSSFLHDPAQALNVLSIGAVTHKDTLATSGSYQPVASAGEMSPYGSSNASANLPIKPEIVMEGGNACPDGTLMNSGEPDLSSLTLDHRPSLGALLAWTWATSAACAAASGLLAEIWNANPGRRPLTVRALLVNSARWTAEIVDQHPDRKERLRAVGYGEPQRDVALMSTTQRPTLILESSIAPNVPVGDAARGMHLVRLPLPDDELLALGGRPVELAVTLSYFGEPNESRRTLYLGATLAWDLQRRGESADDFVRRVSDNWRARGTPRPRAAEPWDWAVGPDARGRGTVQADRLMTDAASLAGDKLVAVWPTKGWWSDHMRTHGDASVPYSLVVTIDAGDADIDLHALVEARLSVDLPLDA